ncbi:MAG: Hsp33 family molecular chaperone HslO [Pseudomonadales bacterium]|nr:Hsp33 family molecular chaperone HslO [Pseudomonadales bacterium]
MSNTDQVQRILFDNVDVRGVVTALQSSFQEVMAGHNYPPVIENILGEMLAAVTILSTNLKFNGKLILQAKGQGSVSTLMAECNHRNECRAFAQFDEGIPGQLSFKEMLAKGHLVLTIEPDVGRRYQGYVPLEQESLALCLEEYFQRSEQLATKFILACDGQKARGIMLQVLPAMQSGTDDWQRLALLTQTLSAAELLALDNETLLYRLFHEEQCRLFTPQQIEFKCQCSRQRSEKALTLLDAAELREIVEERGSIDMGCQICNSNYSFDAVDVEAICRDKEAKKSGQVQ